MPKVGLGLVVLAVAAGGCGGSGNGARGREAVRQVLASPQGHYLVSTQNGPYSLFPSKPASVPCHIPAGGVTSRLLPGTCATLVTVRKDGSAVVRFVETWGNGIASYTMEFSVAKSGHITGHRDYGQGPPQDAV
jgi:hypothetical protein